MGASLIALLLAVEVLDQRLPIAQRLAAAPGSASLGRILFRDLRFADLWPLASQGIHLHAILRDEQAMTYRGKSAVAFIAIGLLIYAGLYFAAEQLMYRNGHSNPFFKIATATTKDFDWVILGASHAMPLDFSDFNNQMQNQTGLRSLI